MRAWTSPDLPSHDDLAPGPAVRVHDSAAAELVTTDPQGGARMYVCGITPYDATHLGHAATYVAFDLLNRAWRAAGHDVRYVQNVTDVDDPLLERATATGIGLGRARGAGDGAVPHRHGGAAGARAGRVRRCRRVDPARRRGGEAAARARLRLRRRRDLYFSVHADPRFGGVSRWDEARMLRLFGERGGDPDRKGKKHPLDCLLWQAERPGEPAWDSELGRGRPGWHVECSAIALHHLGETLRRPGWGQRPGLPAPRDERRRGPGGARRRDLREDLRARRHGRLRGREDVEVEGQPGARLPAP